MLTLFLLLLLNFSFPQATGNPLHISCDSTANYTANSTYESNLRSLLSTLTSNVSTSGFAKATAGLTPDQVYGLVLCRGDVSPTDCNACVASAIRDAPQGCAYDKGATIFYDYCVMQYSNLYFLDSFGNKEEYYMWNNRYVTDEGRFDKLINQMMTSIADYAAYNSSIKYASGKIGFYTAEFPNISGVVRCTPDMSTGECRSCLQLLLDQIPTTNLKGKEAGRILGVRCLFRYAAYQFLQATPTLTFTAAPEPAPAPAATVSSLAPPAAFAIPLPLVPLPGGSSGKKGSRHFVLPIAITLGIAVILVIVIFCWRRNATPPMIVENRMNDVIMFESLLLDQPTIKAATSNFSEENKIGEGGFGEVYKGLLADRREVAVKKLLASSNQGLRELKNELILVAKLQHRNLVRLIGVCFQEEKLIVYEYVRNESLDKFLFDPIRRQQLTWDIRHKIIHGIARGMLYLHEESQLKVIHRDLKASNILLDETMNPKISDFGLAKLFDSDQSEEKTNKIAGTRGYMPPEYAFQGLFSNKSDVFSFGVLILEIVTGRSNNGSFDYENFEGLLSYTWAKWSNGSIIDVLDSTITKHRYQDEMLRCIHIALLCVQDNPSSRPNMSGVCMMLSTNTVSLQLPSKPAYYDRLLPVAPVANENESNSQKIMTRNFLSITEFDPR